jgi:hypothetical protein
MGITPINSGSTSAQAAAAQTPDGKASAGDTSATSSSKKDAVVISQQAKDLAALQAGKSAQEEMNESFAAKQQEGPNS